MKTRILPGSENPAEVAKEIFYHNGDLISENDIQAERLMWTLRTDRITEIITESLPKEAEAIKKEAKAVEKLALDARSPSAQAVQLAYRKKICEEALKIADIYSYASLQMSEALEGLAALRADALEMANIAVE